MKSYWNRICMIVILFALAGYGAAQAQTSMTVFASGLNNPRGLTFNSRGELYVAEGGTTDNKRSTIGKCTQVNPPIGPYTGGHTSRISKINAQGKRTTLLGSIPSSMTNPGSGGFVSGVADLKFWTGDFTF